MMLLLRGFRSSGISKPGRHFVLGGDYEAMFIFAVLRHLGEDVARLSSSVVRIYEAQCRKGVTLGLLEGDGAQCYKRVAVEAGSNCR